MKINNRRNTLDSLFSMRNVIHTILLFVVSIPLGSCQNKNKETNMQMKFEWQEGLSSPAGFPIQIYEGGLTAMDGTYVGFADVMDNGYWGQSGNGMSSGAKPIPKFLHVKWLSFAERCFYEVDVTLDEEEMYRLFKEGYLTRMGTLGIQQKTYDAITTGFAPGGVVVVWLTGIGKQTEVGRYQGKKIVIPQSEIDKLDSDRRQMFDQSDWQRALNVNRENLNDNKELNPEHLDLKKKLDNSPIPFGLWDIYRIKYNWKPVFELQNNAALDKEEDFRLEYFNGEIEQICNTEFPLKKYEKKAIPTGFAFFWKSEQGITYAGNCSFDEASALAAFKEIYGEHADNKVTANMEIRVNIPNTFFTVRLRGSNGKEVFIKTAGSEAFQIKK